MNEEKKVKLRGWSVQRKRTSRIRSMQKRGVSKSCLAHNIDHSFINNYSVDLQELIVDKTKEKEIV